MPSFLWGLLGGPHQGCAPGSGKVLGRAARCCQAQLSRPRGGCGQGAAACWCQGRRNFGVEVQKRARRGAAVCCWSCRAHSGCQSEPNSIEIKCALTELLFMDLQGSTSCSHAGCPKEGRQALGWQQVAALTHSSLQVLHPALPGLSTPAAEKPSCGALGHPPQISECDCSQGHAVCRKNHSKPCLGRRSRCGVGGLGNGAGERGNASISPCQGTACSCSWVIHPSGSEGHSSVPCYFNKTNPLRKKSITTVLKPCHRDRSGSAEFPGRSPRDAPRAAAGLGARIWAACGAAQQTEGFCCSACQLGASVSTKICSLFLQNQCFCNYRGLCGWEQREEFSPNVHTDFCFVPTPNPISWPCGRAPFPCPNWLRKGKKEGELCIPMLGGNAQAAPLPN